MRIILIRIFSNQPKGAGEAYSGKKTFKKAAKSLTTGRSDDIILKHL